MAAAPAVWFYMMPWRMFAEIYTAYKFACLVTPDDYKKLRACIVVFCTSIVTGLNLLPLEGYPYLSLFSTLIGIPCQIYMIYVVFKYIQPAFKSTPITVLCVLFTFFEILSTCMKLHADVDTIINLPAGEETNKPWLIILFVWQLHSQLSSKYEERQAETRRNRRQRQRTRDHVVPFLRFTAHCIFIIVVTTLEYFKDDLKDYPEIQALNLVIYVSTSIYSIYSTFTFLYPYFRRTTLTAVMMYTILLCSIASTAYTTVKDFSKIGGVRSDSEDIDKDESG